MEDVWLREIQSSSPTQSRKTFEAALDIVELSPAHRRFHGKVYHTYLKAIGTCHTCAPIQAGNPVMYVNFASSELNEERTGRLCRGFWSLSHLRLGLSAPPQLKDNPSCAKHVTQCIGAWNDWCREKLRSLNPPPQDPRDLLQKIQSSAVFSSIFDTYTDIKIVAPCGSSMAAQLKEMTKIFDDTLPDHFMIPSN